MANRSRGFPSGYAIVTSTSFVRRSVCSDDDAEAPSSVPAMQLPFDNCDLCRLMRFGASSSRTTSRAPVRGRVTCSRWRRPCSSANLQRKPPVFKRRRGHFQRHKRCVRGTKAICRKGLCHFHGVVFRLTDVQDLGACGPRSCPAALLPLRHRFSVVQKSAFWEQHKVLSVLRNENLFEMSS